MSRAVWQKLQIDPDKKIILLNVPENYFTLIEWPFDEQPQQVTENADFVHLFTNSFVELSALLKEAHARIKQNGTIWISHYKKASKKESELDSNLIREFALSSGLVDNKICSINEDWTACRVVIPVKDRKKKNPLKKH